MALSLFVHFGLDQWQEASYWENDIC
jgi:hypothetical protein